jgi:hypothetical protein
LKIVARDNQPEASPDWCHSCCKLEPRPDDYYQICGECGHVFVTASELEEAALLNIPEKHRDGRYYEVEAASIFFCPLCAHDF